MCIAHNSQLGVQLRFILPVLPLFNIAAACALARLLANARKSVRAAAAAFAAAGLLAATLVATGLLTLAAHNNYPGVQIASHFVWPHVQAAVPFTRQLRK